MMNMLTKPLVCFVLISGIFAFAIHAHSGDRITHMKQHPASYIEIHTWSVYSSWGGVGIIHSLVIENKSEVEYTNVKVRVAYTTTTSSAPGTVVSQHTAVLPVTLPAGTTNTYLKEGMPFGASSHFMNPLYITVVGADHTE